MSISAIESVLQQMRATAVQSGIPSPIGSAGPGVGIDVLVNPEARRADLYSC